MENSNSDEPHPTSNKKCDEENSNGESVMSNSDDEDEPHPTSCERCEQEENYMATILLAWARTHAIINRPGRVPPSGPLFGTVDEKTVIFYGQLADIVFGKRP